MQNCDKIICTKEDVYYLHQLKLFTIRKHVGVTVYYQIIMPVIDKNLRQKNMGHILSFIAKFMKKKVLLKTTGNFKNIKKIVVFLSKQ